MLPGGCGRPLGQLGSGHLLSIAAARVALRKHRADSSGGLTLPKGTPRARPLYARCPLAAGAELRAYTCALAKAFRPQHSHDS